MPFVGGERQKQSRIKSNHLRKEPAKFKRDATWQPTGKSAQAQDPLVAARTEYSDIEGFEDWTLTMIRDFISCMDTARKKCAQLRETNPDGQVSGDCPIIFPGGSWECTLKKRSD